MIYDRPATCFLRVLTAKHLLPRLTYGNLCVEFIESIKPYHISLEFRIFFAKFLIHHAQLWYKLEEYKICDRKIRLVHSLRGLRVRSELKFKTKRTERNRNQNEPNRTSPRRLNQPNLTNRKKKN